MRKRYTNQFKAQVVQEILKEEKTLNQLAAEHSVHPTQLKRWKAIALEGLPSLFSKDDPNLPANKLAMQLFQFHTNGAVAGFPDFLVGVQPSGTSWRPTSRFGHRWGWAGSWSAGRRPT